MSHPHLTQSEAQVYLVDPESVDIVNSMRSVCDNFNWIPIALIERVRASEVYRNVSKLIRWIESQPFVRYFNSDGSTRTALVQTPSVDQFMYHIPDELDCEIIEEDSRFTAIALSLLPCEYSLDDIMLAYDPWIHDLAYSCKTITRSTCPLAMTIKRCNRENVNQFIPELRDGATDHEIVTYIIETNPLFSPERIYDKMKNLQNELDNRLTLFDDIVRCDDIQHIRSSYDVKTNTHELDILIDREALPRLRVNKTMCNMRMSSKGVLIEFRSNTSAYNHSLTIAMKLNSCCVRSFCIESYY
uniref:Uncharacterized protein n=1 Tax=viral metagenome TaxID=1070528 RepID=A0A6C0BKF7_9ZZZZ